MDTKSAEKTISYPRLIPTIVAGFNTVTKNISLIIFPIVLDLFLWLGPHLRLKTYLEPTITNMGKLFSSLAQPEMNDLFTTSQQLWQEIINRFNLFSSLRSLPVGIPSLISSAGTIQTPFGNVLIFEMPSLGTILTAWLGIFCFGTVLGCLYFNELARSSDPSKPPFSLKEIGRQFLQSLILFAALMTILIIIAIPTIILISFMAVISPFLAQIVFFIVTLLLLWFLLPLFFSPHGIFIYQQSAFTSLLTCLQVVRIFLPGASMFILVSFLVYQGINLIWQAAPETSWMTLVGIAGHAFISTSLITASFIYYRGGIQWMQEKIKQRMNTAVKL